MAMRFHGSQKGQIRRQKLVILWDLVLAIAIFVGCCRHRHHGPVFAKMMSNEQAKSVTPRRVLSTVLRLFFEMEYKLASPKEIGYDENHEHPIGMFASSRKYH